MNETSRNLLFSSILLKYPGHVGSGFFFDFQPNRTYIVSNRHVAALGDAVQLQLTRAAPPGVPAIGQIETINVTGAFSAWIVHPNPAVDLAILPFDPIFDAWDRDGKPPYISTITPGQRPGTGLLPLDSVEVGEPVYMVGYPAGFYDARNNLPIVRSGVVASPPSIDFEGGPHFAIDCAVFGGSSGSPVYVLRNGVFELIGIQSAGAQTEIETRVAGVPQAATVNILINLGICVKASELAGFVPLITSNA